MNLNLLRAVNAKMREDEEFFYATEGKGIYC